jgi:predicted outer membrane repeat protein
VRHRLATWSAVAILAAAAGGASEPALPLEVDPGDPECVTKDTLPHCSLRAALDAVNAAGGGVIRLAAGSVHSLTGVAAVNGLEGGSGLPSVSTEMTIEGNGAIVERSPSPGTPPFRIFHVAPQGRLTLRDLTVRHGLTEGHTDGGGLWNTGTLVLERVTVTGNAAGDDGGGIRNDGVLRMIGCFVIANRAGGKGGTGGGLYNLPVAGAGEATLLDTVLRDNEAGDRGGAIWNSGTVRLEDSTLEGNTARVGGGAIRNTGSVSLTRCRIVRNRSEGRAGGISALGPVEASDTTLAENSAPSDPDYEGDFRLTTERDPDR